MKERETFASRLGFVLISAGCAIGLGNVWRFPYIVGQYGGAAFVLIYLLFLVIMGLPIMAMEFSVGRASRKSILASFQVLEPKGEQVALVRLVRHGGQLPADDVLHHHRRLAAALLLQGGCRRIPGPGCRRCGKRFRPCRAT